MSRNERFVSVAKRLLAMQVAAGVGATAVAGWAFFEVRDLVRERDLLAARVAQLESGAAPVAAVPEGTAEEAVVATAVRGTAAPVETVPDAAGGNASDGGAPPRDVTPVDTGRPATGGGTGTPAGGVGEVQQDGGTANSVTPTPVEPVEPAVERNCQAVNRRPIVCVPPYSRTPVPGVCLDGRGRPMRCPPGEPRRDPPRDPKPDEPLTRR